MSLPFWMTHGVDQQYGGVLTCLDQTGKVIDTDKAVSTGTVLLAIGRAIQHLSGL